jgi:predicted transglutaminase-like cysteine proteinase
MRILPRTKVAGETRLWGQDVSRIFAALTAALGLILTWTGSVAADDGFLNLPGKVIETKITTNYGNAKPPSGFLKFCERLPGSCAASANTMPELELTQEQWRIIDRLNRSVNRRVASVSDQELYGQREYWTFPDAAGDCEDYVLMKRRELASMGFSESALLITVVLDEHLEGHAVLTLSTTAGDFILDNRRDDILHWSAVNYKFLKRQTAGNPSAWVALLPQKNQATPLVASRDEAP